MKDGEKAMKSLRKSYIQKNNKKLIILFMCIVLLISILLGIMSGSVWIGPSEIIDILNADELTKSARILYYVRGPRVIGAVIAGMGLSAAGAVIQTILNNPLAGPNIIGVNAGAGLAVALCSVIVPSAVGLLPISAFIGAFITMLMIYFLGEKTGSSKLTLVLAGVAINSLLGAFTDLIHTLSDDAVLSSYLFKIGGLSGIQIEVLKISSIAVILSIIILLIFSNELEVLSLGEHSAKTLGLPVKFYRLLFLMLASVLAGASVSFAGLVGFVGLIVPHVARLLVGDEISFLIPTSVLIGAILMVLCDLVSRVIAIPFEIPVGIVLSFVGAPFFIFLLFKKKRGMGND